MLAALESVDYVVVFDEPTPHALLEVLQPDVLVKGGTYAADEIVGREVVHAYGGEAKVLGVTPGVSTTEIVRRLRNETSADLAAESISASSFGTDAFPALDSRLPTLSANPPDETRRKAG